MLRVVRSYVWLWNLDTYNRDQENYKELECGSTAEPFVSTDSITKPCDNPSKNEARA